MKEVLFAVWFMLFAALWGAFVKEKENSDFIGKLLQRIQDADRKGIEFNGRD